MKKPIVAFLFSFFYLNSFSQDIIVLRKDESLIKCNIKIINDTIIGYHLWKSEDTTNYTIKKYDVLSFTLDKSDPSRFTVLPVINPTPAGLSIGIMAGKSRTVNKKEKTVKKDTDGGILGLYHSGETVEGYVIHINGDTAFGFINIENPALNQAAVIFMDSSGNKNNYTPANLIGFGYNNIDYEKKYVYKKEITNGVSINDGNLFLHRVVNGPAKLYNFYTLFFPSGALKGDTQPKFYLGKLRRYYLIVNSYKKAILTKGRTLKGSLRRLFPEDTSLYKNLEEISVENIDMPQLIRDYNLSHTR